jgi:hypothetical protein
LRKASVLRGFCTPPTSGARTPDNKSKHQEKKKKTEKKKAKKKMDVEELEKEFGTMSLVGQKGTELVTTAEE